MTCAIHPDIQASAYCRTCGRALCETCKRDVKGVVFCQDCLAARLEGAVPPAASMSASGVMPAYVAPVGSSTNPVLATLLGLIPGVGAFYNGQFAKAFVHVAVFAVLISMAQVVPGPAEVLIGFSIATWYAYMVFDAYKTAKARQLGLPLPDPLNLNSLFGTNIIDVQTSTVGIPSASGAHPAAGAVPGTASGVYPAAGAM